MVDQVDRDIEVINRSITERIADIKTVEQDIA